MAKEIAIPTDLSPAEMVTLKPLFEALALVNDDVTMELSNVSFIDSSGIGAVVFLFKRLHEHGRALRVIGAHGQPLQLLPRRGPMRIRPRPSVTPSEANQNRARSALVPNHGPRQAGRRGFTRALSPGLSTSTKRPARAAARQAIAEFPRATRGRPGPAQKQSSPGPKGGGKNWPV